MRQSHNGRTRSQKIMAGALLSSLSSLAQGIPSISGIRMSNKITSGAVSLTLQWPQYLWLPVQQPHPSSLMRVSLSGQWLIVTDHNSHCLLLCPLRSKTPVFDPTSLTFFTI